MDAFLHPRFWRRAPLLALGFAVVAASSADTTTVNAAASRLPVIAAPTLLLASAADDFAANHVVPGFGKLPIRFEPNVGQAPTPIKFLARSAGYSVALSEQGMTLSLHQGAMVRPSKLRGANSPALVQHSLLRLSLAHAAVHPALRPEQPQKSISNYFIGSDRSRWHSRVANYGAVRYGQIYPGIDWVVYGNPQQLEYDLIVAPRADPRQIKLKIEGADRLSLDDQGDLLVDVRGQTLRQLKPLVYQLAGDGYRRDIDGHYVLDHDQVTFALGNYDRTRRLIIDPALAYSTYLGGSGGAGAGDNAYAIAVDSSGNAYVAGQTASSDFPTASPIQTVINDGFSAFITKFNADGSALVYSTYLGSSGTGEANGTLAQGIAVDGAGNAYVAGTTGAADFPTANAFQVTNNNYTGPSFPSLTGFVTKISPDGSMLVYSTYLGGSGWDRAWAIAVDSAGSAYVTGGAQSSDFPVTANPFQSTNRGFPNAFVTKFNAAGNRLVYSTYLGGSSGTLGTGIAVDSAGNAYVIGTTTAADFPTADPFQSANNSATGGELILGIPPTTGNAFVSKFNADGSALVYSTYLGGSKGEYGAAIAVDSAGSAYVAGTTTSTDFPTLNAFQSANNEPSHGNAFVTKFNAAGSALVYSTYLGGTGGDAADAIAVDGAGNAYVTGSTGSTDFPTVNPLQTTNKAAAVGSSNAFISQFNAAGSALVYSTYLGGSGPKPGTQVLGDSGTAIAVDSTGNTYVAGHTLSIDFPTFDAFQSANKGLMTAFVAKIVTMPPAPTAVAAMPGSSQITLSWKSAGVSNATYDIYQGTSANGESATPVLTGLTGTSATVPAVMGTTYYFEVATVVPGMQSAKSAEISAAIPQAMASSGAMGGGGAMGWGSIVGLGLALAARLRRSTIRRTPQGFRHYV